MPFEIIDINNVFGPWPQVRAEMPVERLVGALEVHQVSEAVAISTVGMLHSHMDGNSDTLKQCTGQEKLMPAATIDPRGFFAGGLVQKLQERGFKLVRFFPILQEWELGNSAFKDALEDMAWNSLPGMIEASQCGTASRLLASMEDRKLRFILEGITFENMSEAVSVLRKSEYLMVETSGLRVPGALRFLVDQVGMERVLFGSGCLRSSLAAAIAYVNESELTDQQKEAVFSLNAARLLGG